MDIISNLLIGFNTAFSFSNLLWCLLGVTLGTLVGILPGLGPFTAISILLPITYHLDPISGIIMLSGIYYGTQYGGSTTSILLNLPGESSSVVTTIDGYQMTKNGQAGKALSIAAIGSFTAGIVATVIIAGVAVPLALFSTKFGPAEYTLLMVLGLISSVVLVQGSFIKSFSMVAVGILVGMIGVDINSGIERYTFDIPNLYDGLSFIIIAIGIFGLSEIIYNIFHTTESKIDLPSLKNLYPSINELKQSLPSVLRGSFIGSFLGMLPGAGSVISSFASYSIEKNISKNPEKFGKGTIEGVAGPESANNAGAQTSFIPMLSLGIPFTPIMALIMAALLVHDIRPGPFIVLENPDIFWGLIVSMLIGNCFLLILNLPLISIWISILRITRKILYPCIIVFCFVGAYFISNSFFNVFLLIPFAILGYIFKRLECHPAPLAMGFVIGPALEEYFRRSLMISNGDWMIFFSSPISLIILLLSFFMILYFFKDKFNLK